MEKYVRLLVGVLLIGTVVVTGCNDDDDDEEDTGPAADTAPTDVADADVQPDTAPDAPDVEITPSVAVMDQTVDEPNQVTVNEVVSDGPGWMVIHEQQEGEDTFGAVIGQTAVDSGTNTDVVVELDRDVEDGETLYAMLHADTGEIGTYEFGEDDLDPPVSAEDGGIVVEPFVVSLP